MFKTFVAATVPIFVNAKCAKTLSTSGASYEIQWELADLEAEADYHAKVFKNRRTMAEVWDLQFNFCRFVEKDDDWSFSFDPADYAPSDEDPDAFAILSSPDGRRIVVASEPIPYYAS